MRQLKWWSVFVMIALMAVSLYAQQSGLVNVNVSNVSTEIAKNINVNVSQIPVTVQVPVSVAANVCGIAADVLASQIKQGQANCDAKSTNQTLNQIVQQQINQQKQQR